jgi:ankyrin repeat protein
MDPLSIGLSSIGLVKLCTHVSKQLVAFISDVRGTPSTVQAFQSEINHLSNLLGCIAESFQSGEYHNAMVLAPIGYENQFWQSVSDLLKDCKWTLEKLTIILRPINVDQRSFLGLSRAKNKLDMNSTEITTLREEIKSFTGMINITFSMINMYVSRMLLFPTRTYPADFNRSLLLSRPGCRQNALAMLTPLQNNITELHLSLQQHTEIPNSQSGNEIKRSRVIRNMKKCITSAQRLVSTAPSVVSESRGGSVMNSEIEDKIDRSNTTNGIDDLSESKTSNFESNEHSSTPQDPCRTSTTNSVDSPPQRMVEDWLKDTDLNDTDRRRSVSSQSIPIRPTSIASRHSTSHQRKPTTSSPKYRQSPQVKKFIEQNDSVERLWREGQKQEAADLAVEFLKSAVPQGVSDQRWEYIKQSVLHGKGQGFADGENGYTALHLFAAKGLDQYMAVLLQKSASVEVKDENLCTPLHFAARNGHQTSCKLLLANEANIAAKSKDGCTPLHFAAQEGHTSVVKLLIDAHADIDARDVRLRTPLCCACGGGQLEAARFLLENGAEFEAKMADQWTPLHYACRSGSIGIARLLISRDANVAAKTKDNSTPLHICCQKGHLSLAEYLLETADVKARDGEGKTPLHLACRNGHDSIASLLLRHGADIEAQSKHGYTPLHSACEHGQLSTAKVLLERRANAGARDKEGRTPLYIACKSNHEALARFLSKHHIDVATKHKYTPLHISCENGFTSIVALLLENRAGIEAKTADGFTPLYCAARNGHTDTISFLIKNKANIRADGAGGRYTPLHIACQNGHLGTVKLLIAHGADIGAKDKNSRTPLRLACEYGRKEVACFLLETNANIETKSKFDYTPLHSICQSGHLEIAQLLLDYGADVRARTIDGKTPLDIAKKYKHGMIVSLLKETMKNS